MLRAGHSLRFTPTDIEELRKLGLDVDGARTQDDLDQALTQWAGTLAEERPQLLDKIARALAEAKGVSLPARLTRVR
jgi:acyl-CoA reductase-like NAD-dependent aldehyde dehydrogenase